MRNPAYFNQFDMYLTYFGIIIIIFLVSFVASVTVEMPFLNLDKLLFSDRITKTKVGAIFYFKTFKFYNLKFLIFFSTGPTRLKFEGKRGFNYFVISTGSLPQLFHNRIYFKFHFICNTSIIW